MGLWSRDHQVEPLAAPCWDESKVLAVLWWGGLLKAVPLYSPGRLQEQVCLT